MSISSLNEFRKRCDMEDDLIRKLHLKNWFLLLLFGSFSLVFMSPSFSLGVLAGGLIVNLSFHSHEKILGKLLDPSSHSRGRTLFAKHLLRLLAVGLVIYILISRHYVDALGLLVGLSIVVINLMFIALNEIAKTLLKQGV